MRRWYHSSPVNRAKVRAYQRKWRAANRDWLNFTNKLHRYGLTLDQFHARYESQDFSCAICKREISLESMHVDHDHETDKPRGLLCVSCNTGIGLFQEDRKRLKAADAYLVRHAA